jgi:hypothetical protein
MANNAVTNKHELHFNKKTLKEIKSERRIKLFKNALNIQTLIKQ